MSTDPTDPTEQVSEELDHQVLATTREGRVVPIWDALLGRDRFSRDEATATAARYNANVREYRYEARRVEGTVEGTVVDPLGRSGGAEGAEADPTTAFVQLLGRPGGSPEDEVDAVDAVETVETVEDDAPVVVERVVERPPPASTESDYDGSS